MQRVQLNVIPFKSLNERFGHAVGFRTAARSRAQFDPYHLSEVPGLVRDIRGAVVAEPLKRMRQHIDPAETVFDRLHHEVPDYVPGNAARGRHIAHNFPITTVPD